MGLLMALPLLWLLFAAHFGGGGVGFEEDVGGFFEEVFAELVESFLTRGPVNLLVFLGFQPLSTEVIHEEAVFVGWADWRGEPPGPGVNNWDLSLFKNMK